jgi:hypothetical protein
MARFTSIQAAHSYGVLDPHVIERRDTKFLGGSLSDAVNIVLLPQGGYQERGGSLDKGRARRQLAAIALTTMILAMPNGGSAADLIAGEEVTVTGATGSRYVIAEATFADPVTVHFVDVARILIETTPADGAIVAEWHDGTTWQPFGQPARLTLRPLSRRIASGAPGHAGHTATRFRLAIDATTAAGDVTLAGLRLFAETSTLTDAISREYAPEQGQPHVLLYTAGNIDVFEAGTWRAAVAWPGTEQILRQVKAEPRYDTITLWHTSMRPQEVRRLGVSTEWACDDIAFENVPLVDYGEVYTNGVTEVQELSLYTFAVGDLFELTLEGVTTAAITADGTGPGTATNIKNALEALSIVEAGLTVAHVAGNTWRVTFTGGANADRDWLQMVGTALNAGGFVRVRTITPGKAGGEPIISDARGWPAVGRFAQQRLLMGGLKSRPKDILGSVTGDPYDLNTEINLATAAFSYEVEGNFTQIRDILAASKLLFFTDRQVVFMRNETLSRSEVPKFVVSDAPGIKATERAVPSDNAIYYFDDAGPLQVVAYSAVEENFGTDNASVLSAHLIRDARDLARRRAIGVVDSDVMLSVNADGSATALTLMRSQEVSGFAPWMTDGKYRSFCTDHANQVWQIVERLADGTASMRFELQQPDELLDEAVEIALGAPASTIAGLARFNGRAVWVIAGDALHGPFTVEAGAIDVGAVLDGTVRVGSWVAPSATDPDVSIEEETRQREARLKRINRAVISVLATTSLAIRANDGPLIDLPLRSNEDTILDEGPLARPVDGRIEAEGMHGFTRHGRLTVTQTFPGKLTVRSVTKNMVA